MINPRQPRAARSSTAQTTARQLVSPGSRPMTLTLLRVSPLYRYRDNGDYAVPVIMPWIRVGERFALVKLPCWCNYAA